MDIHDVKKLIREYSETNQCFTYTQKRKRLKMLFFFFNKQLIEICKQVVQDVFL